MAQQPYEILGESLAEEITTAEASLPKSWGIGQMPQIRLHMSKGIAKGILNGLDSPWYDILASNQNDSTGMHAKFFSSGQVNFGSNYGLASVKRTIDGTGKLRGVINSPGFGIIINLPPYLRPVRNELFTTTSGDIYKTTIGVWIDGTIRILYSETTSFTMLILSGIEWETV